MKAVALTNQKLGPKLKFLQRDQQPNTPESEILQGGAWKFKSSGKRKNYPVEKMTFSYLEDWDKKVVFSEYVKKFIKLWTDLKFYIIFSLKNSPHAHGTTRGSNVTLIMDFS